MGWILLSGAVALLVVCAAIALALPGLRNRVPWVIGVSVLGAVLFTAVIEPSSWSASVAWGVFAGFGGTLVAIDLETRTLPREISLAGAVLVAVFLVFSPTPPSGGMWSMALGAGLMTLITALLVLVSRGALGLGDLFLSPLLGTALGWVDPWLVVLAWLVTALAGGAVIAFLLVSGRVRPGTAVPYGPFMVFGTFVVLALGGWRA